MFIRVGPPAICAALVIAISMTGCARPIAVTQRATLTAPPPVGDCAPSRYPLVKLAAGQNEPSLAIPRPPGWDPVRFGQSPAQLRLIIMNKELRDPIAKFTPIALVTLRQVTAIVNTPDAALDHELRRFNRQYLSQTPGKVCGHPSMTVTYRRDEEPHGLITMCVVAGEFNGQMYAATAAMMSTRPDDAKYLADQQAMFNGFVVELVGKD